MAIAPRGWSPKISIRYVGWVSKQSQTEMAVLGALEIAPLTGYAIRQQITQTLGQFWSESYGQIYPTLSRLVRDGLVEPDAPGRTSGTSFRISAAGQQRLRGLLQSPSPAPPVRNARLLRLFFGAVLGPTACMVVVEEARGQQTHCSPALTGREPRPSRRPIRVRPIASSLSAPANTPFAPNAPGPRSP